MIHDIINFGLYSYRCSKYFPLIIYMYNVLEPVCVHVGIETFHDNGMEDAPPIFINDAFIEGQIVKL